MRYSVGLLVLLAFALVMVGAPLAIAEDKADKNTHVGTFVSAKGEREFTMKSKDGKEHTHKLAADARVFGLEGKECHLKDFKEGQRIRVTTKDGDSKTVTKVEALKKK